MRRTILARLLLLAWVGVSQAATRYIDNAGSMSGNCTSSNYSITNRNCTGGDGNAYTTIAAALSASGTNDTIRLRTGSYATPSGAFVPKAGQTWEGCRAAVCGSNETATITGSGQTNVIFYNGSTSSGTGVTIRYLSLTGGTESAIVIGYLDSLTLDTLDISGWNTSNINGAMGIQIIGDPGDTVDNLIIRNCVIHDAANIQEFDAGIHITNDVASGTIELNTISGTSMGIWFDVHPGDPGMGYTPLTVQNNVVNVGHICFHIECSGSWHLQQNIGYSCNEGIRVRPDNCTTPMSGHRVYNNTLYATSVALWLSNDSGVDPYEDNEYKNNIFMNNHASRFAVQVDAPNQSEATTVFENNIVRNRGAGSAVCWGGTGTDFGLNCDGSGVTYANSEAGIDSWNSAATNVSYTGGMATTSWVNPIFVDAANGDFRLCTDTNQPVSGCSGASPGIDVGVDVGLSYNGSAPDMGALESTPPSAAPVITAFTATSPVNPGAASTLAWTVTDATSCTPSMTYGTDATWTGSTPNPVSGSMSSGVFTAVKRVYRLSCTGAGGGPVTADATVFGGYRLAKHPSNGHWLRWMDGSAKMLLGYGLNTWKPTSAEMDTYQGKMNYWRLFAFSFNELFEPDDDQRMGMPVVRSGGAGSDWDYATWNQNFWDNLHTFLTNAYDHGIAAGICLWDGHWALPGGLAENTSTWTTANNIQSLVWSWTNSTTNLVNATPCPTTTDAAELGCYQQKFMERLRDELAPYPHVIIELNNEDSAGNSNGAYSDWYLHWATLFNNAGFMIAVTEEASTDGDAVTDATFNSTASLSMKSYHTRSGNPFTATRMGYNKMIVNDGDNSGDDEPAATARLYAWRALVRGGHWNDYTEAGTFPIAAKLDQYGYLLSFLSTYHPPLTAMVPNQTVGAGNCMTAGASSPLCLWQSGTAWLLYVTANVTVNLAAAPSGTLNYRWYNPVNGAEVSPSSVTCPCTTQALTKPSDNTDMVLYIGNVGDVTAPAAPLNLRVVSP